MLIRKYVSMPAVLRRPRLLFKLAGVLISLLLYAVSTANAQKMKSAPPENRCVLQPPRNAAIYVVAHRGAHQGIPENSLPAYEKAIALGCDFVEIDARTTKDGKLVSMHNARIYDYVDGAGGVVKAKTLADLRPLDIGVKVAEKWRGTRIPTIEQILQLCKGRIGIYLDIKDASISALLKLIDKYEMECEVLWYLPFKRFERLTDLQQKCARCLEMPDPGPEKKLPELLKRLHPPVIASYCDVISTDFIELAHAQNALVIADEKGPESWQPALDLGVDGLQTDYPEKLIAYLKKH